MQGEKVLNANSLRLEYACRANRSAENCERKREMGEEEEGWGWRKIQREASRRKIGNRCIRFPTAKFHNLGWDSERSRIDDIQKRDMVERTNIVSREIWRSFRVLLSRLSLVFFFKIKTIFLPPFEFIYETREDEVYLG